LQVMQVGEQDVDPCPRCRLAGCCGHLGAFSQHCFGLFHLAGLKQCAAQHPEQARPLWVGVVRPQRERGSVVPSGRGEGVQRKGAVAGGLQRRRARGARPDTSWSAARARSSALR